MVITEYELTYRKHKKTVLLSDKEKISFCSSYDVYLQRNPRGRFPSTKLAVSSSGPVCNVLAMPFMVSRTKTHLQNPALTDFKVIAVSNIFGHYCFPRFEF